MRYCIATPSLAVAARHSVSVSSARALRARRRRSSAHRLWVNQAPAIDPHRVPRGALAREAEVKLTYSGEC